MWIRLLELGDASTRSRDGKIAPKGESCIVPWPETIIEQEETVWLWIGYPEMNQQEWARVALARLSDRIAKQHDIDYSQATTLITRKPRP